MICLSILNIHPKLGDTYHSTQSRKTKTMAKNLWERDRKTWHRALVREYQREGYSLKEARRLARKETDEIMADKEGFVNEIIRQEWEDEHE